MCRASLATSRSGFTVVHRRSGHRPVVPDLPVDRRSGFAIRNSVKLGFAIRICLKPGLQILILREQRIANIANPLRRSDVRR